MVSAYIISELINSSDWYNKSYFEIIFLILLILLALRLFLFSPKENQFKKTLINKNKNYLSFISLGLLTGCITSLSGMGGGVILIPFLTDITKISIKKSQFNFNRSNNAISYFC